MAIVPDPSRTKRVLRHPGNLGSVAAVILALLVASAAPALAESRTFELLNGDILRGEVLERDEHRIVIQHAVLGRLEIPIDQIAPSSLHPGVVGTNVLAGWTKELAVGLGGSQGDTDEADLRIAGRLERLDERNRWQVDGNYVLSFAEGKIDDNNARVTVLRDWLWPESPWFAFVYGIYDFDEFEAWKHRPTLGFGPGYHFANGAVFKLDGRSGVFTTWEFGEVDALRPEGAAGLFASWKFGERHGLVLNNVWFQTLDEAEFRIVTRLEWKLRLSIANALSVKFTIDNEYDSASDQSTNNLKYFTSMAVDF
jgi:hypothetical protein